jgi:hypothetical protein
MKVAQSCCATQHSNLLKTTTYQTSCVMKLSDKALRRISRNLLGGKDESGAGGAPQRTRNSAEGGPRPRACRPRNLNLRSADVTPTAAVVPLRKPRRPD